MCSIALFGLASKPSQFALHVFGEAETVDASVFVDGKQIGTMTRFSPEAAHFTTWLPVGGYKIEVRKEGYVSFEQSFSISSGESEYYVDAKLSKRTK